MPLVRVEIDGEIKTGPSENIPALLKNYPQAKVLGPAPSITPGKIALSALGQTAKETLGTIVEGATFPGRKIGEMAKQLPTTPTTIPLKALGAILPKTGSEVGLQLAMEAFFPVLGVTAKTVAPASRKLLAGVPRGATERIIEQGLKGKNIIPAFRQVDIQGVLSKAADILTASKNRLGQAVGDIVNTFSSKFQDSPIIDTTNLIVPMSSQLASIGIRSMKDVARSAAFGGVSNTKKFISILQELASSPKVSPKRLYELKTQAQEILNIAAPGMQTSLKQMGGQGKKLLQDFSRGIDDLLEPLVPGFKEANKKFADKSTVYDVLRKRLFSGDPVKNARELLNPNSKLNQNLRNLGQATKSDLRLIGKLKDKVSAFESRELISDLPRTGFGAYLLGSKPSVGIPFLASTSPRLTGLATQVGARAAGAYRPGIPAATVGFLSRQNNAQ